MNCEWCGTDVIQKSKKHKFCSTSCRVYAHNERTGKKNFIEPTIKVKSIDVGVNNVSIIENTPKIIETPHRGYIEAIQADKKYWISVYNQSDSNTHFWKVLFATVGYLSTDKKGDAKYLNALGLGFIGSLIDKAQNEARQFSINDVRQHAMRQITKLDRKLKDAEQLPARTKNFNIIQKYKGQTKIEAIMSTEKYLAFAVDGYVFKNSKYGYFLGNPSKNFTMLLHGLPGSGKTTFSIQFADYFHKNFGKVLYVASEQKGINYSLQKLIQKNNAEFDIHTDPKNIDDIKKVISGYKLVILDSIQSLELTPDGLRDLRDTFKDIAFVCVSQVNKDGAFKGSNSYLHDVDIEVKTNAGKAELGKNRFAMHKEMFEIF